MQNFEKGESFLVHLICKIFTNIIKLSSKNLRKNVKKYYPMVSGTCFHYVISFTSSPFGVSSLFRHTQCTLCPNPRISPDQSPAPLPMWWVPDTPSPSMYTYEQPGHTQFSSISGPTEFFHLSPSMDPALKLYSQIWS